MARTVKDTNLQTREAREGLKARHNPYWRTLDPGAHLGYRKGVRGVRQKYGIDAVNFAPVRPAGTAGRSHIG